MIQVLFEIYMSHQWAYKQGHSTETLLLYLTEVWKNELDNGRVIGMLFIDFPKAFDSLCHVLKRNLKIYGIEGKLFDMLEDYLKVNMTRKFLLSNIMN